MQLPSELNADALDDLLARALLVFARRGEQILTERQKAKDADSMGIGAASPAESASGANSLRSATDADKV